MSVLDPQFMLENSDICNNNNVSPIAASLPSPVIGSSCKQFMSSSLPIDALKCADCEVCTCQKSSDKLEGDGGVNCYLVSPLSHATEVHPFLEAQAIIDCLSVQICNDEAEDEFLLNMRKLTIEDRLPPAERSSSGELLGTRDSQANLQVCSALETLKRQLNATAQLSFSHEVLAISDDKGKLTNCTRRLGSADDIHDAFEVPDDIDDESNLSHTSSLESSQEDVASNADGDELGSSTSASEDSFELKSEAVAQADVEPSNANAVHVTQEGSHADCSSNLQHRVKFVDAVRDVSSSMHGDGVCVTQPALSARKVDTANEGAGNSSSESGCESSFSALNGGATVIRRPRPTRENPFLSPESKQSIADELTQLDTGMPHFDFDSLEQKLVTAAQERELLKKKLASDDILEAQQVEASNSYHPPAPTTKPLRSNLANRLRSGMNLQICFMNDTIRDGNDEVEDNEFSVVSNTLVPKSKSTPDLGEAATKSSTLGRSISTLTGSDCEQSASELRRSVFAKDAAHDVLERTVRLQKETQILLLQAKQAAEMQMEVEKRLSAASNDITSPLEQLVGVALNGRRLNRLQLTRMSVTQLQIIVNSLHEKVAKLNEELVQLLIERDSLHMEQDSMLVDIEDVLQHQRCEDLKLPDFLILSVPKESKRRLRIFKR